MTVEVTCLDLSCGNATNPPETPTPQSARAEGLNVVVTNNNGSEEVRSGGTRAWRNNNPGNIRSGDFARSHGSIGEAGGFAVFPSEAAGQAALTALLNTNTYQPLTINQAISRYAPPSENDTANYQRLIQQGTGLDGDTRKNELTPAQLTLVANTIRTIEGWREGTVTVRR